MIDLAQLEASGCFTDDGGTPKTNGHSATHSFLFDGSTLNAFAAAPATERAAIRQKIITLLEDVNSIIFKDEHVAYPLSEVKMHLPMQIGDFTDFMCSLTHVNNVSTSKDYHQTSSDVQPVLQNGRCPRPTTQLLCHANSLQRALIICRDQRHANPSSSRNHKYARLETTTIQLRTKHEDGL